MPFTALEIRSLLTRNDFGRLHQKLEELAHQPELLPVFTDILTDILACIFGINTRIPWYNNTINNNLKNILWNLLSPYPNNPNKNGSLFRAALILAPSDYPQPFVFPFNRLPLASQNYINNKQYELLSPFYYLDNYRGMKNTYGDSLELSVTEYFFVYFAYYITSSNTRQTTSDSSIKKSQQQQFSSSSSSFPSTNTSISSLSSKLPLYIQLLQEYIEYFCPYAMSATNSQGEEFLLVLAEFWLSSPPTWQNYKIPSNVLILCIEILILNLLSGTSLHARSEREQNASINKYEQSDNKSNSRNRRSSTTAITSLEFIASPSAFSFCDYFSSSATKASLSWVDVIQKPLFDFIHEGLLRWPLDSFSRLHDLIRVWVEYLQPWNSHILFEKRKVLAPLPINIGSNDSSDLFHSGWSWYIFANLPFYSTLLSCFLNLVLNAGSGRASWLIYQVLSVFNPENVVRVISLLEAHYPETLCGINRKDYRSLFCEENRCVAKELYISIKLGTTTPGPTAITNKTTASDWDSIAMSRLEIIFNLDVEYLKTNTTTEILQQKKLGEDGNSISRTSLLPSKPNRSEQLLPNRNRDSSGRYMLLNNKGRQQLRQGIRVCSNLDVPFCGDEWQKPTTTYEIKFLLSILFYISSLLNNCLHSSKPINLRPLANYRILLVLFLLLLIAYFLLRIFL